MVLWHKTLEHRFSSFPAPQQVLMICNELNRAGNNDHDPEEFKRCLERSLELLGFLINDEKWRPKLNEILRARDVVAEFYLAPPQATRDLQRILLQLDPGAWKMLHGDKEKGQGFN